MNQQKYQDFSTICRENGWKCTSQRLAVYDFICGNLTHPGVDEVWNHIRKNLPSVTRESVYRILNELAEYGILHRVDHIDRARYDSQTVPHGHFICEKCGVITDFSLPAGVTFPADTVAGKPRHIELRISGICNKCNPIKHPNTQKGEKS